MTITQLPEIDKVDGHQLTVGESAFEELYRQYQAMEQTIHAAARFLPEIPWGRKHRRVKCCRYPQLKVVTIGMSSLASYDPDTNKATSDGWDDITDDAPDSHIECNNCYRCFRIPENFEWSA